MRFLYFCTFHIRSRSNAELHDLYFKSRNEGLRVILGRQPHYRWLFAGESALNEWQN